MSAGTPDSVERFIRDNSGQPVLSKEEEFDLAEKTKAGDSVARDLFIRSNIRLVIHIANDYQGLGVDLADLIASGTTGLMHAVDLYDPEVAKARKIRFSMYARHWIRHKIFAELTQFSRQVPTPAHVLTQINKMRKVHEEIEREIGHTLHPNSTDEVVAEKLGIKVAAVRKLRDYRQRSEISIQSMRRSGNNGTGRSGSPAPSKEADGADMIFVNHRLADPDQQVPEIPSDVLDRQLQADHIRETIDRVLDKRERMIVLGRFPLDGKPPKTFKEIAKSLPKTYTREYIRQICESALLKLKAALAEAVE